MRVDLKKYLFIGVESARAEFFKEAQEAGIIDFIKGTDVQLADDADIHHITGAIKVLRGLPPTEQEETDEFALADGIATKILQLEHHLEKLNEQKRMNNLDMSRVEVFGNFSVKEIEEFEKESNRKVQYFFSRAGSKDQLELPDELIFIDSEKGLDYFVAINKEPQQYQNMVEMQIPHSIGELRQKSEQLDRDLHQTEQRLKGYAKYNRFLHHALIYKMNTFNLKKRTAYASKTMDGDLFAVEGWVPVNKKKELIALIEKQDVHAEEIAIEPTDIIPTYLENEGYNRIGEDLVHIYDTPSNTDKDPSFWILTFFAFFFAMIIGDAGYGLIFLATAIYIRYRYKKMKPLGNRVWWLMVILACTTIFWGTMTSSFFGLHIGQDNPLRKISLINWLVHKKAEYHFNQKDAVYEFWVKKFPNLKDAKDSNEFLLGAKTEHEGHEQYDMVTKFADNVLLELALMVGVFHLIVSFIRYLDRNWSGIGWIIALIGSYLFVPQFIDSTSIIHFAFGLPVKEAAQSGLYLMIGGFAAAFILALIRHRWLGLLEPTHIIQIFADTMSYLRLYALAFAGAVVVETINGFAGSMNIVFGAILFIFGHLMNIVLGVMAGVIHGLRLNFLEWYHYSFEGGGKNYNPLRKLDYD